MKECCDNVKKHPDHQSEIKRLNRIAGQIEGIKTMITSDRYCPDIMTQLKAVQSAIKAVEMEILKKHLEGCVLEAFSRGNQKASSEKIEEILRLLKK